MLMYDYRGGGHEAKGCTKTACQLECQYLYSCTSKASKLSSQTDKNLLRGGMLEAGCAERHVFVLLYQ